MRPKPRRMALAIGFCTLAGLAKAAERTLSGRAQALAPELQVTGFAAYIGAALRTRRGDDVVATLG